MIESTPNATRPTFSSSRRRAPTTNATLMGLLRGLGVQAAAKGAIDGTAYGEARHSPQDFVTHHVAAISAAGYPSAAGYVPCPTWLLAERRQHG